MPTREIILDENRRLQLENNINDMLSNGIDEDGIASFVSEYKSKFGQPVKKKDVSFGSELPYAKTSFDAPSPSIENISQSKLASPSIPTIEQATKKAAAEITAETMDVPVEAVPAIKAERQAEKDLELKKQMLYNDMRYARILDKKQAQERGYNNIQDYYKDRETFLINNYLSEDDKEEARAQNAFAEAKKSGNDKLASEEMQNLLNSKSKFRANINEQREEVDNEESALKKTLEAGMPQDAFDAASKVLAQKRATLDLMSKPYYDPKLSMDKVLADNITEVAAVSKPSQTAKEKLTEYTNALYTQLEIMREDLGWDADGGALDAYAKDFQLRRSGKGELVDKMYETELKLRNAVKILELNKTPIDNENALGVFGKSFATSINPASASKQNTEQVIAQNLQSINEDSGISAAVDKEQKKFAEENAKEYKPYSAKWFAQPAGASAAIMLEFIPASMATEGAFGLTKIGKLINIAEKYGKVKGLNTTAKYVDAIRKYKTASVGDKIGRFVLKTQANGLKFGTTSEVVAQLFPKDADEVNFTTGYFGGQIGKGAEQLIGGAATSLMKVFGSKAPEAVKAIERLGEQFKFVKDAPKNIVGEIGEELGESLGQIYSESDSWKEIQSKLNEQFGTLDKATQFVIQTGIMALGMGGGSAIGSNLMKSSKDAYNKLSREQRAVVDEVLDSVSDEESKVVNDVESKVESEVKEQSPEAAKEAESISTPTIEVETQTIEPINEAQKTENIQVEPTRIEGISVPNEPTTPITDTQKEEEVVVGEEVKSPFGVKIDMNISEENSVSIMEDIKQNPELAKKLTNREANILSKKYNSYFENLNKKADEKLQSNIETIRNLPPAEKTKILDEITNNRREDMKKQFAYDKLLDDAGVDRFNMSGDINSPETYHFTSAETVKNILEEDSLFGEEQEDEGFGGISTTTNKDFDNPFFATVKEYGSMFSVVSDFSSSAVNIKLDLDKLKKDGYSAHKGNESIGTFAGEEEVRIIKKGEGQKARDISETEITNVSKYIKEIVLDTEKLTSEQVFEIKKLAKEKGIDVSEKSKAVEQSLKETPKAETQTAQIEQKAKNNLKNNQNEKTNDRKPAAGNRLFNEPIKEIGTIADKYFKRVFGKERPKFKGTKKFDEALSRKIADAYAKMENNPNSTEVKSAYNALVKETIAQYKALKEAGYEIEVNKGDPYNNSQEMIDDVVKNKTIKVFSTEEGFGDNPITEQNRKENPMLQQSGIKDKNGVPLLNNDLFRAIHDIIAHGELGNSFGAIGEENAFQIHARLYSPLARKALATETRGQNSFVNFSGINDKVSLMVEDARRLRAEGKEAEAQKIVAEIYKELSFAEQKIGILPKEFYTIDESFEGEVQINNQDEKGINKTESEQSKPIAIQRRKDADKERTSGNARNETKREEIKSAFKKLRDEGLLKTSDKTLIGKAKNVLGIKSAPMSDAEIDAQMALIDAMADVWEKTTGKDNFYETFIADVKKGNLVELQKIGGVLFQDVENTKKPTTRVTLAVFDAPQFEKMKGLQVTPQTISDLVKGRGKQIEKDIINMVLDYDKYKGQKRISFDEFRSDVETQIMKLEKIRTNSYANYGYDNLGDNENYGSSETVIFNSPIEHGEKGHFSGDFTTEGLDKTEWELKQIPNTDKWAAMDKNMPAGTTADNIAEYVGTAGEKAEVEKWIADRDKESSGGLNKGLFGHIRRWFNKGTGVFNIAELQSDYYQKNKASDLLKPEVSTEEIDAHMNKNVWKPMDDKIAANIKKEFGITVKKFDDKVVAYDKEGNELVSLVLREEPLVGLNKGDFEENQVTTSALKKLAERRVDDEKLEDGTYKVTVSEYGEGVDEFYFKTEKEVEKFAKVNDGRFNGAEDSYDSIRENYHDERQKLRQTEEQKFIQKRQAELEKTKPANILLKQFVASQKVHELRLLREAIKMAADEGAETVRFPDQYTLAVIEGYTDATGEGNAPYEIVSGDSDRLYEGDIINYGGEDMVVVEQDRSSITVAPKDEVSIFNVYDLINDETTNRVSEIKYEAKRHFGDMDAITKEDVESYEPDEWFGTEAKSLLEEYFEQNEDEETVSWKDINQNLYDKVNSNYSEMSIEDVLGWAGTTWQDNDTLYVIEGRNYETFNQPDEYEASSTKEDYYDNLSSEQKTVVDKYGELGKQFEKMRTDARLIQDDNGMGWYETAITEEDKNNPIVAFQKEGGKVKGAIDFANNNKATLYIFDGADISTLAHEMSGHLGRRVLEKLAEASPEFAKQYETAKKWAGVKDVWTTKAEEKFARGFERYLRDGVAPTKSLKEVFSKLKEWLSGVYKIIKGSSIDVKLTDDVRNVFDSLLGKEQTTSQKEKVDTKAERDRQIELLDTEKKIAQLEKEMRYAPIRPSRGVLSKKQIRIQIKNYKNQLRELKGLPPRKVITDSVFRINLRAFGTEVDENNLPHEERVVLEAMGRLNANDKDIVSSDGNAKLRQQGALKTKGGDSINQIVKDYIDENSLDSDTEQDLRDAIIRFVNGGDAYAYMDNIKEREAQNDPNAIRDEEYYNYGYQGAMEYELTDEEISELEQEIGKLNDITQEEYEQIKQEFSDTQAGEGTNRLEDKADSGKQSKSERKAIAEAKIDDIANALKDFLPSVKGVKTSGVTQDKIIDLIAEAVKALVNAGIEINEAIKQVKERLSETFNVDELSDFDIKMTIAKNDLKLELEKAGISYKQAIFTVNKYLREVGGEDVITKEELAEALKNKENSKEREGYESREKTSGRSKSYAEGRVPVSEEYKADVERNKVSYTSMDMFKNAEKAIELLSSFGGDIKGLQKAYEYILTVFNDNPYRNPENAVAIELLADRFFARSQEAYKEGNLELSEELADKSNSLRLIAFNTATKAGQWNAALAVFSRAVNPDAFLYFVEGQVAEQNEVTDSNSYTNTARKVKKDNAERATKEFKKKAKEIADQTAKDVAKGSPTVKSKPINSRFTKLKDKGVKRQKDALAKLKKIGFLGSNGLNNEAIEAIGELILSQLEIGIYKAATIAQRIKEMTDGKVTDAHLKEVLDNYKVDYEGKEYSLSELSEQLEKEYKKDNVDAELKKRSERAGMVEKGQKRKSLSELIELQLSENANVEAMTKAIMAEFDLSESAAKALATKYVETYKRVLTERINKQLLKDLGIKNVKEIESKENSGEVKPFHQTLGGKIVGEIMAGALTTGSAVETAFMQKYGFPVLTPNMKTNIRLLALRTNEAKTVLGQKVANRALITYLQSIMPTSTVSILNTLYYVSLLSGITTAAVNTLGNANTLVLQNSENFVQSIVEAAQGEPANLISSVQGKAKVKRAIANFTQSINTFLDIMAKGGGESKYYNLNQKALDSFDSERLIPKKEDTKNLGLTKAAKLLGQIYYSIPAFINRNLPASDDAFSMSNFNTEAAREVRRNLAKTGLKGKELEDAVFEKIYGTAEIVAMAKLDAIAEINRLGLDPKKEKRLIKRITVELIQSQLDPRVQNAAKAISAENTYRGANRGATGIIGAAIPQNIVFAPFVGTVMRIVEKMVNYIPFYSIARATGFSITDIVRKNSSYVDKLFERKGVLSPKKEGELRAKQIAQVVFTHAVVGIVYALTQIGWEDPEDGEIKPLLEFSGGYLGVPKSQKEMLSKETEMPPYTMRWKGTKYNYKQNPLLVPIGIMFSINSDLKRAGIKELSLTDLNYYATVVSAISMFLLNATPVANMKDFFKELGKIMDEEDVLESSDIGKQFMKSFVAQIPANIAIPNTYKQAFDFLDPQVFQTNTIADVMWKSVNMERIGGLIPAYDYWGRDIERYPAESTYPFRNVFDKKTDVVDKWMIKNNINTEPLNTKTLVLDLDNNTSYTKKKWDEKVQLEQNKLIGVEDNELYEVDAKFRLLTQLEWANMDKTVRQNVRKVIEENLNNVKDEELFETPLVEYTKKEAEKKVRQLFKEERQKYIRKNFNKEKE